MYTYLTDHDKLFNHSNILNIININYSLFTQTNIFIIIDYV